jgi:SRSO17 transposase
MRDGRAVHVRGRRARPGQPRRAGAAAGPGLRPPRAVAASGQVHRRPVQRHPRKNGWTIAEHVGDRSPDKTQRLLNYAVWDEREAMAAVREFVIERLGGPDAVAVLDETGQEKKGERTAGVKRQYVGCAGKVANAVNVVCCSYASDRGHALVDARPYLPKEWADDPARRAQAGVPDDVEFKTKPQLGTDILADLHAAAALPPWVTGYEVYGRDPALRGWCEEHGIGYVLGVARSFRVRLTSGRATRADKALGLVPATAWTRASCGQGSKGDRTYDWAWVATASPRHHLLIRRNLSDPTDQAFFYCHIPEGRPATLPAMVKIAGRRWPVEEDFQTGKDQFGLDHSQVRLHTALTRHLVLATASLAIAAVTAAQMRKATSTLPQTRPAPTTTHPKTPASSPSPSPRSNACATSSPDQRTAWPTTCTGTGGDDATKPAPNGTTNAPASNAKPKQHDQVTKCGCHTRDHQLTRTSGPPQHAEGISQAMRS